MGRHTTAMDFSELRGSRRWTEDEGRQVIEAWKASGETVAVFARVSGLVPQRVYWWRDRLEGASARTPSAPGVESAPMLASAFLPVIVRSALAAPASASANTAVTVCVRDGVRVEVMQLDAASATWVATLVKSLEVSS